MSSLADLDRSKVVDVDLGSDEFKQHARAILAGWAKRPPFYVLSSGPPQVVCGRYADVHEVFSVSHTVTRANIAPAAPIGSARSR